MGQHELRWESRESFFGAAARLMRRILADYARRRNSDKRGAAFVRVDLTEDHQATGGFNFEFLALDRALDDLAAMDPELAHLFELRFFGGLEVDEIAKLLDVSTATAEREWVSARAWLWNALTVN